MTGTQNVVARDAIFLLPGFSYIATQGQSFNASINSQLEIPLYSTGEQIVNPNTRDLEYSLPVGTLPGSFDVNSYGAATYTIPIFISPGTAGMQPSISIVYNNLINDGLLGKCWDIAGLSTIQRVPQNFYHEDQIIGVSLQNTDKFALDSNRLVLTSGAYGADGSEYKTEIETFVLVTAHGTAGTGPVWFEVETKDGRTLYYGNTASSRVEAYGSSTVNMWRINRIMDQHGNFIDYNYYENNGESYIKEIRYAGNFVVNDTANLNKIEFGYGTRTDHNAGYVAGSKVPKSVVLTSIKMETGGNKLVREYQFRYVFDFYTHLNEIVEYGSDHKYLNSTAIGWGNTLANFASGNSNFNNSRKNIFYLGDFDGDGRTDFVVTERKTGFTTSDKWELYLSSSDGMTFTKKNEGYLDSYFKGFTVADVDGNGMDDIYRRQLGIIPYECNPHPCDEGLMMMADSTEMMASDEMVANSVIGMIIDLYEPPPPDTCWDICYTYNNHFLYYYFNSATGLERGSNEYDLIFDDSPMDLSLLPADLDGNGKADYLVLDANNNLYAVRGVTVTGNLPQFYYPSELKKTDFDGDGRKDILVVNSSGGKIFQYSSSSQQFSEIYSNSSYPTTNDRIYTGDFNGDKKTDILSWNSGWTLKFSTGNAFETSSNTPAITNTDPGVSTANNNIYIKDFNGDKKDDILESFTEGSGSKLKVFFSRGGGVCVTEDTLYAKAPIEQDYFNFGDFNGDGKQDLYYYDYSSASNVANICFFHKDEIKHLVSCFADGLNYKTKIYYSRLNNSNYTKWSSAQFPVYDFNGAFYVVTSVQQSNGLGTDVTTINYVYEGLQIQRQGKGFLAFRKTTSTDDALSFSTVKEYSINNTYYYSYLSKSTVLNEYEQQISQVIASNALKSLGNKRIFPYLSSTLSYDNLTDFYINNIYNYDDYGNLTSQSTEYRSGGNTDVYNTLTKEFGTYGNYGIANKLVKSTSTSVYTGQPSYSRIIEYTYNSTGDLLTEKIDPTTNSPVTKTYSLFNSFGLPAQVTISAGTLTSRTTFLEYDSKNRFVTKTTNPAGHYVSKTYDDGTGNILTETGIDNNTTTYQYDSFGRLSKTITPQGNEIMSVLHWDGSKTGGTNSIYYQSAIPSTSGIPDVFAYYDLLGREVMTSKEVSGNTIYQTKTFNADGTLYRESWPYFSGETPRQKTFTCDNYGRIISENNNGLVTSLSYNLGSTTVTDQANQVKTTKVNSAGNVIRVTENNNNTIDYMYHSSGQVKNISTAGTTVSITYDALGRRYSITDPNYGTTTYNYNAFGEITRQKDSRDSIKPLYNTLGQVISKTTAEGITTYTYVTSGNGIEQVQAITGPNGVTQSYSYDTYGRVTQITETISGDQSLITGFGYDSWGHNTSVTYPSGIVITNLYNSDGYLSEIKNSSTSIWKLDEINSSGQPEQYSLGSSGLKTNFEYDTKSYVKTITTGIGQQSFTFNSYTGNLTKRTYKKTTDTTTVRESFTYDELNRLYTSKVGTTTYTINYSDNGNITYRTDVGNYSYDSSQKNAVVGISNNPGTITEPDNIAYTHSNMTSSATVSPYTIDFTYDPDDQRIKSVLKFQGTPQKTKYYSGSYEKEVTGSRTRHLHYISGPYGLVAVLIKEGETITTYYTETDHLGSIIGLMNSSGTYAEQFSYDPWGRRRNPTDWTFNNVPDPTLMDRGFTGHEHLDKLGLINMNGRMYDPILGRFLGVDPMIQMPDNSQSFNGYSYCLNNPLKYTDPSGYSSRKFEYERNYYASEPGTEFFNNYPGGWEQFQNNLSTGHYGTPSYTYDWGTNTYRDKLGRIVLYNEVYSNYIIPNSLLSHEYIQLGPGRPNLTIDTYDTRKYSLGDFEMIVRVYGKQYENYNFIQSVKDLGGNTWELDDKASGIHGFYYDDFWLDTYSDEWYRHGSNAYFEDNPHNEGAQWQMTICGRRGNIWETITTISWGYSVINGKIDFHYNIVNPASGHQQNINNTLYYWNHKQ